MTIIKTMKTIVAVTLLAASMSASAGFINGAITMSGNFEATGGSDLSTATGINFLDNDFEVDDATEDFADAGIMAQDIGTYYDFSFDPLAAGTTVWSIGGFSFALDTISVSYQSGNFIALEGRGYISATGFDDTYGYWNLTGNRAGGLFNFSSGANAVSEPATLGLIGLGFLGLAAARRRTV